MELAGAMTHFATADELKDDGFFEASSSAFARWALPLKAEQPEFFCTRPTAPASCATRSAHFDMVRCGIAIYGMDPFGEDPVARALEPALELSSYVAEVKRCRAGESAGYGRRFVAAHDTCIGVAPDRLRRRLAARRCPTTPRC